MQLAVQKTARRFRKEGLRATLLEVLRALGELLGLHNPINAFDLERGTDTGGSVPLWKLKLDSPNAVFGVKYQPSEEEEIRDAVAFLSEDPKHLVFVDLGCGKGRTLLVAAKLGFKKVIGVEFATELAAIARKNLAKTKVTTAAIVQQDAADYPFPDGDLVVYLYNPFQKQVMEKVVANLKQCRAKKLLVIYKVPNCAPLFDGSGFLSRLGSPPGRPYMQVWKMTAAMQAARGASVLS